LIVRDLANAAGADTGGITAISGYLGAGHLNTTTEPDLLAWAIILWLLVKLLAGGDRRLWVAVGLAAGIGLENKATLLFLGAGLAVGLVATRRWDVIRSRWAWSAIGIALLLWLPNLAWQAANGWPQLTMARAISQYAGENRGQIVPLLWLFTGPFLFPVTARSDLGSEVKAAEWRYRIAALGTRP
jgi:4-amino-4-deoxy-L-arabinose transferase-like glycosyltransferase